MILTDEDYEVYIYVFEYIFQNIIFWTYAITIGVVCRKVKEMLVFILAFIPLRKTSGGSTCRYHRCLSAFFGFNIFYEYIYSRIMEYKFYGR